MCFFINNQLTEKKIKSQFSAELKDKNFRGEIMINGFSHPNTPIILDQNQKEAVLGNWGLIPSWAQDKSFQKNTLNAQIEGVKEKPSFRNAYQNRCLVLVNGFYEWRWKDEKGKQKEKHYITLSGATCFALGGIYSIWFDAHSGLKLLTFSIITTPANEIMSKIHNTKKRMPVILDQNSQIEWLQKKEITDFVFTNYDVLLESKIVF